MELPSPSAWRARLAPSVKLALNFLLWFACHSLAFAEVPEDSGSRPARPAPYRTDRILVQPKPDTSLETLAGFHSAHQSRVLQTIHNLGRLQVVSVPAGETVASLVRRYQQSGLVQFAEPDYIRHVALEPNDPKYLDGTLWGLNNYGQSGGTPHDDIDATNAWEVLTSASNIVVAILDTGVRYTHEDLTNNMWSDASGNHGTNAIAGTSDPSDDNRHGTLMAGIIGAEGNNGLGVVGVAWRVQIMACKCFDASQTGTDSAIIACIDYARQNGARIINASFGGFSESLAASNAIYATREAGIIFVAAAGNAIPPSTTPANIDLQPYFPACHQIDNIVSVAYSTRNDTLGFLSNYGATNVDLAAPGDQIYSTSNGSDSAYFPSNVGINVAGTSFAAAYVSGSFALLLARFPGEPYQLTINRLLHAVDPVPALTGKCVAGGRLNLRKALSPPLSLAATLSSEGSPLGLRVTGGPNRTCVVQAAPDLVNWSSVFTNTTSTDGTFDFIDPASTNLSTRFYRAVASP